jgi:hypothetical protein
MLHQSEGFPQLLHISSSFSIYRNLNGNPLYIEQEYSGQRRTEMRKRDRVRFLMLMILLPAMLAGCIIPPYWDDGYGGGHHHGGRGGHGGWHGGRR